MNIKSEGGKKPFLFSVFLVNCAFGRRTKLDIKSYVSDRVLYINIYITMIHQRIVV